MANTYYILTDKDKITLSKKAANHINSYKNAYEEVKNLNELYALKTLCNILLSSENVENDLSILKDIKNILSADEEFNPTIINPETNEEVSNDFLKDLITELKQQKGTTYWYDDYDYTEFVDFISRVEKNLSNLDKESVKNNLIDAETKINNALANIINNNGSKINDLQEAAQRVENDFNENPGLQETIGPKYNEYSEIKANVDNGIFETAPKDEILEMRTNLMSVLTESKPNNSNSGQSSTENTHYVIVVGGAMPLINKINKLANNITDLYSQIEDTSVLEAQTLYAQAMQEFINNYQPNDDKAAELQLAIDVILSNDELSDEVRDLVRQYAEEAGTPDPDYVYTEEDKAIVSQKFDYLSDTLNDLKETNNALLDQIENYNIELESLIEQYKEKNDGEEPEYTPVDDTIKPASQTEDDINVINNVYAKSLSEITGIIVDSSSISMNVGETKTINITYEPEPHKPFAQDAVVTATTSTANIINVSGTTADSITITAVNDGDVELTITMNNVSTTITINVEAAAEEPKLFYFGQDDSVITNDNDEIKINTDFNKFINTYSVDDIIGKYDDNYDSYDGALEGFNLIIPASYEETIKVLSHRGDTITFDADLNRRYTDTINGIDYVIFICDTEYNGDVYIVKDNETIDEYANMEPAKNVDIIVTHLILDESINLTIGEDGTGNDTILRPEIYPEKATNKTITWTSTNPTIATVDENGRVTPHTVGTVNITGTAEGSVNRGVTVTCNVTVTSEAQNNYLFYFGHDRDVINVINNEECEINEDNLEVKYTIIHSIDDIVGKYDTGNISKMIYLVLPSEFNVAVVNDLDREIEMRKFETTFEGNAYSIYAYITDTGFTGIAYIVPDGESKTQYENAEPKEEMNSESPAQITNIAFFIDDESIDNYLIDGVVEIPEGEHILKAELTPENVEYNDITFTCDEDFDGEYITINNYLDNRARMICLQPMADNNNMTIRCIAKNTNSNVDTTFSIHVHEQLS